MNIVFIFLYAVFYDCHHHLGSSQGSEMPDYWNSHNRVRKKGSEWRLLVMFLNCVHVKPKQVLSVLCSAKCLE